MAPRAARHRCGSPHRCFAFLVTVAFATSSAAAAGAGTIVHRPAGAVPARARSPRVVGIAGVGLHMSRSQVRSVLGPPLRVQRGGMTTCDGSIWTYSDHLRVTFAHLFIDRRYHDYLCGQARPGDKQTSGVVTVETTSPADRFSTGFGVGSSLGRLKGSVRPIQCSPQAAGIDGPLDGVTVGSSDARLNRHSDGYCAYGLTPVPRGRSDYRLGVRYLLNRNNLTVFTMHHSRITKISLEIDFGYCCG